jgi:hypothetical protein
MAELEQEDPFNEHDLAIQQFIVTARVYDVMLSLLREANPDVARDLLELHRAGHLVATAPSFSGHFLTDDMNDENLDEANDENGDESLPKQ